MYSDLLVYDFLCRKIGLHIVATVLDHLTTSEGEKGREREREGGRDTFTHSSGKA